MLFGEYNERYEVPAYNIMRGIHVNLIATAPISDKLNCWGYSRAISMCTTRSAVCGFYDVEQMLARGGNLMRVEVPCIWNVH